MFACPVCSSLKWKDAYNIGRWDIKECFVCGLARIDPLPCAETRPQLYSKDQVISRNIKQQTRAQKFSRVMKRAFNRIAKRDKSKIFYDKFRGYLPAGSKILDVGCGDGSFLRLAKSRFDCTGIEISDYLADLARQQGIEVIIGDFLSANLADRRFNGITLISLLEHLNQPQQAIKKCFDALDSGGVLLIKTVNYSCLNRVIKKADWTGLRPPDHIFYFNPANLKALLKGAGFTQVKVCAWPFNDNMYCDARK